MAILITIEGLDGTGKSTLASSAREALANDPIFHKWVYQTKEPGLEVQFQGMKFSRPGPDLRSLVLTDGSLSPIERELLFYADASQHRRFMLNQGDAIFVSDRGKWSHLAYLKGYLKMGVIDYDQYSLCKKLINEVCAEPDCVIYLKGDLALMKERLAGKQKDLIESNGDVFFQAVLDTYEELALQREFDGKPLISLAAVSPVCNNTLSMVDYLKDAFSHKELKEGHRDLC